LTTVECSVRTKRGVRLFVARQPEYLDKPIIILSSEACKSATKGTSYTAWDIELDGGFAQAFAPSIVAAIHRRWLEDHPGQKFKRVIRSEIGRSGFSTYRLYLWDEEDERAYRAAGGQREEESTTQGIPF
jgi:hypothetical protein